MNSDIKERQENQRVLSFHDIHDHGTEIADMWIKEVEKRTNGGVRFKRTSGENEELVKAADFIRDVPVISDRYPLLNLVQIPFIFPSSTVGSKVIAQLYAEFPELRNELGDVKVVGLGTGAIMAVFSSKSWGPIHSLEGFKHARIRSLSLMDKILRAFDARPIHVGWFEISQLMESGALDAAVLGILPAYMFKLADSGAPYCTITGRKSITMHPMRIYMKWDTWHRLPANIQKIIEEIGPAGSDCWFAVQSGRDSDDHLQEAMDYIKQRGEIIEITPKELERWRKLTQPILESTVNDLEAKGLPAWQFFNRMIELVDMYS
jgi:TRAP-type C4-dicarboxylate transport system substrate-binding protein